MIGENDDDEVKYRSRSRSRANKAGEKIDASSIIDKALELERQQLPEPLRVKSFVISSEDIKLDKQLMTSTIEIEKFKAE